MGVVMGYAKKCHVPRISDIVYASRSVQTSDAHCFGAPVYNHLRLVRYRQGIL